MLGNLLNNLSQIRQVRDLVVYQEIFSNLDLNSNPLDLVHVFIAGVSLELMRLIVVRSMFSHL